VTSLVCLRDVAHCRAGDKGDDSLLAVFPYEVDDYVRLEKGLQPSVIAGHFGVPEGSVEVNWAPALGGLVIVIRGRLAGGVTRSVRADPHGKTLSSLLLMLEIPWPEGDADIQ